MKRMFKEGDVLIATENNAQIIAGHFYKVRGRSKTDEGDWVYALNDEVAPDKLVHAMGHNFILLKPSEVFPDPDMGDFDRMFREEFEEPEQMFRTKTVPVIYDIRSAGVEYCKTDGTYHYKGGKTEIEPIELFIQNGIFEDWAISNIIKYALRFKKGGELNDLKKIADYAHILCGVELMKED